MKWGSPIWLWSLLFLPILYIGVQTALNQRKRNFSRWIDPSLWKRVIPELDWSFTYRKILVVMLSLFFLILAMARPQWGSKEETVRVRGLDIIFLLDLSSSMEVEDVVPSRLKKAKHFLKALMERLKGDRIGVVVFAGSSFPASPLTTDLGYVAETLDVLEPRMVSNQGTDIATGLEVAMNALERGAEDLRKNADASRAIVLVSDGEDHQQRANDLAKKLVDTGTKIFVLGVGTPQGGPVPVRDPEGELRGYKRDARGQAVLSTFHSDALKKLSDESGGRYWEISASESELDEVASEIGKLGTDDREERRNISYVDRYQWPLAIAVFLLIFELFLPARKVALLVLGVLWGANPVYADMQTYRANELALKALSENRPNDAKKHLAEAQSREPDLPELLANQAQTELLEKNVKDAAKSFQAAGELAEKQMRPDIAARSYYNAGTTSAQAGEFNEAVQNYLTAIDLAKKAKDLDVEKKARENLLLLKRQREQQKQNQEKQNEEKKQNDQDRKNQKDDQKDSGEGESKKDDQEEKGQDKKKNQELEDPSVSRERAQKKFESSKMSKEDAERVMAELSSREKELQRRLKKQKGQGQTQEKDW